MAESRKFTYEVMAREDFNPETIVIDLPVLDKLLPMFGYKNHGVDSMATTKIALYIYNRIIKAFSEEAFDIGMAARPDRGQTLWAIDRIALPAVEAYIDYLIEMKIRSGKWDGLLERAQIRKQA